METCKKIEARQVEGKTELIKVKLGYIRNTLGVHLTLRALEALCFSNSAALKHQPQPPKQKNQKSRVEVQTVLSHPLHLEKCCCLWHTITGCPLEPLVTSKPLGEFSWWQAGRKICFCPWKRVYLGPKRLAVAVAPGGIDFIQEWTWGPGNARALCPRTQKTVPTRWAKPGRLRGGNPRFEFHGQNWRGNSCT